MSIEDRLRDELEREGNRDVDVDALYAATRRRIDSKPHRTRTRPMVLVAASAAAVLSVTGGGLMLDAWQDGDAEQGGAPAQYQASDPPEEGPVDTTFGCPNTTKSGARLWDPINVHHPKLGWKGVERYKFVRTGDTGVLRVGLADNTLTAKIHLRKRNRWQVEQVRHCTGPEGADVAVDGRFELGKHGRPFPDPPAIRADDEDSLPDSSVQPIDDRAFYNEVGVVDRRTVFGYELDGELVVRATDGELDYYSYSGLNSVPADRLWPLADFLYDVPGWYGKRAQDFRFAGYYTTSDDASLTAELKDGSTVDADAIRGDDWNGTLYALLLPRGEVSTLMVERDGETTTYRPEEIWLAMR